MFEVGDSVVHPRRGAGIVTEIKQLRRHGDCQECYQISLAGRNRTSLILPVLDAERVGLRPAMRQSELARLWSVLSAHPGPLPDDPGDRRQLLEDRLHSGDSRQIAEAVRDVAWWRQRGNSLGRRGRRMARMCTEFLASEVAVAQGTNVEDAEAQIRARLNTAPALEVPRHTRRDLLG
jgi:CarD family transcriptional regulator